jgi:hypothetical protein
MNLYPQCKIFRIARVVFQVREIHPTLPVHVIVTRGTITLGKLHDLFANAGRRAERRQARRDQEGAEGQDGSSERRMTGMRGGQSNAVGQGGWANIHGATIQVVPTRRGLRETGNRVCKGATELEAQVRLKTYRQRAGLQPSFPLLTRPFAKTGNPQNATKTSAEQGERGTPASLTEVPSATTA